MNVIESSGAEFTVEKWPFFLRFSLRLRKYIYETVNRSTMCMKTIYTINIFRIAIFKEKKSRKGELRWITKRITHVAEQTALVC